LRADACALGAPAPCSASRSHALDLASLIVYRCWPLRTGLAARRQFRRAAGQAAAILACDGPIRATPRALRWRPSSDRKNLAEQAVPGPEGTAINVTVLYPNDPQKRLEISWGDEIAKTRP